MKKIKYLVFILGLFLTLNSNILGLECKYSDGKLSAIFTIDEKSNKASDAIINGTLKSSDETNIENEKQGIENWDSIFKPGANPDEPKEISAKGADYYKNHKECLPYAIFVDRRGQFDFAVFTESHKSEFKKYGESKQGYAIMPLVSSTKDPVKDGTSNDYEGGSCAEYTEPTACENNNYFACIWNETEYGNYCNTDNLLYVACGDAFDIPHRVPELISFLVNLLKIATPIILIFVSVITLFKAILASKEDEIKKAQSSLIKKIIASVMVFFIISIVQFVISKVADSSEQGGIKSCLECFLNNDCKNSAYYKTNVGGTYICTYIDGSRTFNCKGNK